MLLVGLEEVEEEGHPSVHPQHVLLALLASGPEVCFSGRAQDDSRGKELGLS